MSEYTTSRANALQHGGQVLLEHRTDTEHFLVVRNALDRVHGYWVVRDELMLIGTIYQAALPEGWLIWLRRKHRERKRAAVKRMDRGWSEVSAGQDVFDLLTTKPRKP